MTRPAARALLLPSVLLLLGTLFLYYPAVSFDFVNLDDDLYVRKNPAIQAGLTGAGIAWALTTPHAANYHPLTWLSLMLDAQVGGPGPAVYHATNVLLHAANALLLFLAFARMTGFVARSAMVAALFAVHPLHVESVAWISERKDVLSALFFMLSLVAYRRFTEEPGRMRAVVLAATFALGLAAKPMLVTLPFLLLLLDLWPLKRAPAALLSLRGWLPLLREKVPLFALAALAAALTWIAQTRGGALEAAGPIPLPARAANALVSAAEYVRKMLSPTDLTVFYPHRGSSRALATVALGAFLVAAATALAIAASRKRPYVTVGWFWYCISLLPVVGLVQVGRQSMADRYTYIPLIGLFLLGTWGAADLVDRLPALGARGRRLILSVSGIVVLSLLAWTASAQLATWRSSDTLFGHALAIDPDNYLAESALGSERARIGAHDEAIRRFRRALRIEPGFVEARANLATALLAQGRTDEAVMESRRALEDAPGLPSARTLLGLVLLRNGKLEEAAVELVEALRADPGYAPAHAYLAGILLDQGRTDEAVLHCRKALRSDPGSSGAHHNLALAFLRQGRLDEARVELEAAVRAEPRYVDSRLTLGALLAKQNRPEEARSQFLAVLAIDPSNAAARRYLEEGIQKPGAP